MSGKLLKAFNFLKEDVTGLKEAVAKLGNVRPVVKDGKPGKDGKDGVSPAVEDVVQAAIAQLPEPEKINIDDVVAKIPKPRDGRDAPIVNVSDVAAIVLAKIPKPKDGKDGRNGPGLGDVVTRVKAQVRDGDRGEPGPPGAPGKDGVSVTDVQLNNNELFVFLDGKKKKAGAIKVPTPVAPFSPGSVGGGGSARQLDAAVAIKNRELINKTGDWPDPVGGAVNLVPQTEYYIGDCAVELPAKMNITGPTVITGASIVSCLTYLGSEPMINGTDFANLVFVNVSLDHPNSVLLNVEDIIAPTTSVVNLMDVNILRSGGLGTIKDILGITFSLINFSDLTQGLQDTGTVTAVLSAERISGSSTNAAFKFFDFGINVYSSLELANIRTVAPAGAVAFSGLADNGNVLAGQIATVSSCEFLGGVAPLENITKDDFRYKFSGNGALLPDTNPDALISLVANATPTPVVVDIPTKLLGTWGLESESHFEADTTGRITYKAEVPITIPVDIVIDMEPVSGVNKDIVVYAAVNGVVKLASGRRVRIDANNPRPVPVVWQQLFNQDDYLEVFVENHTDSISLLGSGGVSRIR